MSGGLLHNAELEYAAERIIIKKPNEINTVTTVFVEVIELYILSIISLIGNDDSFGWVCAEITIGAACVVAGNCASAVCATAACGGGGAEDFGRLIGGGGISFGGGGGISLGGGGIVGVEFATPLGS
tara:strand:- start:99 stop:479 length:381 start_codon:yes stop_codon:yes gene_type:complete